MPLQLSTNPVTHFGVVNLYPEAPTMSGANQSYPQTVNLDTAKAKAAQLQSETSRAQGGNINPTDPASKARVCHLTLHGVEFGRMRTAVTTSPSWQAIPRTCTASMVANISLLLCLPCRALLAVHPLSRLPCSPPYKFLDDRHGYLISAAALC